MHEREFDRHVHAADGQDAYGAARAMDHLHVGRQQAGYAMAGNGMGMAPAEFHETVASGRIGFPGDGCGDAARQRAVTEFVDELHQSDAGSTPISANISSVRRASP